MNIPFRLNIFKQIEIYQDLKELDSQFLKQLRNCNVPCKNPPGWFFEKKILYWAYIKHKHLGSPMRIKNFSYGYNYIKTRKINDPAKDFKILTEELEQYKEFLVKSCIAEEEIKSVQIRKIFGNMEAKGLAKFFKRDENNYYNINQENCDGIFITQKGLEYVRMIYSLYEFKEVNEQYKEKIKGVEKVLEIKKWQEIKYKLFIFIAWLILFGSIFLFLKILIKEIMDLV